MSGKIAVTFKRGWGVYNAGETAGFDVDQAEKLCGAGIATKAKEQPTAQVSTISAALDLRNTAAYQEAMVEIEARVAAVIAAEADSDARKDALDRRSSALDARAAELDAREAALDEAADTPALVKAAGDAAEALEEQAPAKSAGLPKQGK